MRLLDGRTPDLVWSDPPYGMKCQGKNGRIGSGNKTRAKPYPIIAGDETTDVAIASFNLCQQLFP